MSPSDLSKRASGFRPGEDGPLLDLLYRRHVGWLISTVRRRFGADLAEDVVQETYLRAASALALREVRNPRALLMSIARTVVVDRHRRSVVREAISQPGSEIIERSAGVQPDQVETVLLKQVILALPPKFRDVFLLSRVAGLTYEEIARHLGISVKTVEWRMTKALSICDRALR